MGVVGKAVPQERDDAAGGEFAGELERRDISGGGGVAFVGVDEGEGGGGPWFREEDAGTAENGDAVILDAFDFIEGDFFGGGRVGIGGGGPRGSADGGETLGVGIAEEQAAAGFAHEQAGEHRRAGEVFGRGGGAVTGGGELHGAGVDGGAQCFVFRGEAGEGVDAVEAVWRGWSSVGVESGAGVGFPVFAGAHGAEDFGEREVFEDVGEITKVGVGQGVFLLHLLCT